MTETAAQAKVKSAINKTLTQRSKVPMSILRHSAEDHDAVGATTLIRNAEAQHYSTRGYGPTDSHLASFAGFTEFDIMTQAIQRAERRR